MKAVLLTLFIIATGAFAMPVLADPAVQYDRDEHYRNDRDYRDRDYRDRDNREYSRDRDWEYHHRHHRHHRPEVSIELGR